MSKGSNARPFAISKKKFDASFDKIFGESRNSFCKHHDHKDMDCPKCKEINS